MSKESSIKVYAENFSGSDKPVNAIPVWIENASAISGGGGGGGSIPSNVSGKWEDASDCVQTNSANWTLPSAFKVDDDGQAYKIENGSVSSIPTPTAQPSNNSREYSKNDLLRVNYSSYSTSLMWKLDTEYDVHMNTSSVDLTTVQNTAWDTATKLSVTSTDWMQQNPSIYYVYTGTVETPYLLSGSDVTKWNNAANRVQSDSANYISVSGTMANYSGHWQNGADDVSYNVMPHTASWDEATQLVQSNSASWTGGDAKVLFHKYHSYDPSTGATNTNNVSGVNDLYFECCVMSNVQPQYLSINQFGFEYTRVYWTQVSSDGSETYYSGSCNILDKNSEYDITGGSYNWCYMSANGCKTNLDLDQVRCTTDSVMKFNVNGYNITGFIGGNDGHGTTQLTSFTGGLSDFTAKGYERYDFSVSYEDYNNAFNYDWSAEFNNGGSTVTSGDVFPPTTGLTQGSKYYLAWNTNNGGLYWEYVGN